MGFNKDESMERYQAVTLAISKRKGSDSVVVSDAVERKMQHLKGYVIPNNVEVTTTRNYGATAYTKVMLLIEHLIGGLLLPLYWLCRSLWAGVQVLWFSWLCR